MAALMIILLSLCEISNVNISNNVRDNQIWECKKSSYWLCPGRIEKQNAVNKTTLIKKVKQSQAQAQRVPGGWGSQISRQSAHEGGKVVSPTHRPLFTPRKNSRYSFLLEAESTPGLCQWKIPMTPSGIEPATFWLIAQCLNQLCHRGSIMFM